MIDTKLLRSQMVYRSVSTEALAEAEGWSKSTAYRKINGLVAFTVQEMQICRDVLSLSAEVAEDIFFN